MSAILSTFDQRHPLSWRAAIRAGVKDCRDELATKAATLAQDSGGTLPPGILGGLLHSRSIPTLDGLIASAIHETADVVSALDLSEALLDNACHLLVSEFGPGNGARLFQAGTCLLVTDARYGKVDGQSMQVMDELGRPCPNSLLSDWLVSKAWNLLFFHSHTVEDADDQFRRQVRQAVDGAAYGQGGAR